MCAVLAECAENEFSCHLAGVAVCIDGSKRCDSYSDCDDGEDEDLEYCSLFYGSKLLK